MTMNLDQIDELRKRANVTYEDAKSALEQCDGNLIDALVFLEKQNKIKSEHEPCAPNNFFKAIKKLIKKGNETKFIVKKDEAIVLNVCVTLVVLLSVTVTPVMVAALILALATNHKIRIEKKNKEDSQVNIIFDKMAVAVNKVTTKVTEEMQSE